MRSLRETDSEDAEGAEDPPAVSEVPTETRIPPESSRPTSTSRAPQARAIATIWEVAGAGQGTRVIALGGTGMGKTFFEGRFVEDARNRLHYVLIHDAKDRTPQFRGAVRDSAFHLHREPTNQRVVIFREEDPETVAELGWRASERGQTSLVVIDELYDAMSSAMHFRAKKGRISEILRKGRSKGVSLLVSTQIPQSMPTEVMDLTDFKVVFRLDSRSLNYVVQALRLDWKMAGVIQRLKRGEFVLIQQGVDWDGTIYGPQ